MYPRWNTPIPKEKAGRNRLYLFHTSAYLAGARITSTDYDIFTPEQSAQLFQLNARIEKKSITTRVTTSLPIRFLDVVDK